MKLKPRTLMRAHAVCVVVWPLLAIPSLLWWKESVTWVIIMSLWANFAAHFAAWQATRTEVFEREKDEQRAG